MKVVAVRRVLIPVGRAAYIVGGRSKPELDSAVEVDGVVLEEAIGDDALPRSRSAHVFVFVVGDCLIEMSGCLVNGAAVSRAERRLAAQTAQMGEWSLRRVGPVYYIDMFAAGMRPARAVVVYADAQRVSKKAPSSGGVEHRVVSSERLARELAAELRVETHGLFERLGGIAVEIDLPEYVGVVGDSRSGFDLDTGGFREWHGKEECADGVKLQVDVAGIHGVEAYAVYHAKEVPQRRFDCRTLGSVPVHPNDDLSKVRNGWSLADSRLKSANAARALVVHQDHRLSGFDRCDGNSSRRRENVRQV